MITKTFKQDHFFLLKTWCLVKMIQIFEVMALLFKSSLNKLPALEELRSNQYSAYFIYLNHMNNHHGRTFQTAAFMSFFG